MSAITEMLEGFVQAGRASKVIPEGADGEPAEPPLYTYHGYRYQESDELEDIVWVWTQVDGAWRPLAFRVFLNAVPPHVPDAIWESERRVTATERFLGLCDELGLDPSREDPQVALQDAIEVMGGRTAPDAEKNLLLLLSLEQAGWCPGWPAAFVERALRAHKEQAWDRGAAPNPPASYADDADADDADADADGS